MPCFRAAIHVRPGARHDAVGGRAPGVRPAEGAVLEVRVRARPVQGAATAAAERALAEALGLRPWQVRVVRGATARNKLVEISDAPADLAGRWSELLDRQGTGAGSAPATPRPDAPLESGA